MNTETQDLKSCKLEQDHYPFQKKRKVNDFYSLQDLSSSEKSKVNSNSNSSESEELRSPLLRSSRGRRRILPSRFSDSVLHTCKFNERIKIDNKNSLLEEGDNDNETKVETELVSFKTTLNGSRLSLVKKDCYTSGISSDKNANGNGKKKKELYKLEDFALNDIVWAKCGKRYPAWPAVVIDPILQAPKSVLNCCVPGAICVMFFGYSKNGKQRVNFS